MSSLIIHAETLETEGDVREAYAAWMADMANTCIKNGTGPIGEIVGLVATGTEVELEDLPF
tara:strand:- start:610 stop:792 length:183 start_codon:yes stop_codon:yes gene_type:complete